MQKIKSTPPYKGQSPGLTKKKMRSGVLADWGGSVAGIHAGPAPIKKKAQSPGGVCQRINGQNASTRNSLSPNLKTSRAVDQGQTAPTISWGGCGAVKGSGPAAVQHRGKEDPGVWPAPVLPGSRGSSGVDQGRLGGRKLAEKCKDSWVGTPGGKSYHQNTGHRGRTNLDHAEPQKREVLFKKNFAQKGPWTVGWLVRQLNPQQRGRPALHVSALKGCSSGACREITGRVCQTKENAWKNAKQKGGGHGGVQGLFHGFKGGRWPCINGGESRRSQKKVGRNITFLGEFREKKNCARWATSSFDPDGGQTLLGTGKIFRGVVGGRLNSIGALRGNGHCSI